MDNISFIYEDLIGPVQELMNEDDREKFAQSRELMPPGFSFSSNYETFYENNKEDIWALAAASAHAMDYRNAYEMLSCLPGADAVGTSSTHAYVITTWAVREVCRLEQERKGNEIPFPRRKKKTKEFYMGNLVEQISSYLFTLVAPQDMAKFVIESVEAVNIIPWSSTPEKYFIEIDPRYDEQIAYNDVRRACELYAQVN